MKSSASGKAIPEQLSVCNHQQIDPTILPLTISKIIDATQFSSYQKLMSVTARILSALKSRSLKAMFDPVTQKMSEEAENVWIKDAQLSILDKFKKGAYNRLGAEKLNGIIVVGKRIEKWLFSNYDSKLPILMPYCHPISRLYATYQHNRSHQGVAAITAKVRRTFWILPLPLNQ